MGGNGGTGNVGHLVRVINSGGSARRRQLARDLRPEHRGGGGSGGSARDLAFNAKGQDGKGDLPSWNLAIGVGGSGVSGGNGGEVRVDNSANLATTGDGALGILAQSIGGGGGNGGALGAVEDSAALDRVKFYRSVNIQVGGAAGASGSGGP